MRATFLLEHLLEKLSFLNHAVSARAQLPALSCFLIEAEKGKLKISATDLEIGITVTIPAAVDDEGKVLVPAKPLSELLGSLSEEKITIEKKEKNVFLVGKKLRATILSSDEQEFPKIMEEQGDKVAVFKKEELVKELSGVVFAAATDSSRPAFSAVYLMAEKGGTLSVATDSHRLSKNTLPGTVVGKSSGKPLLLSARTIRALLFAKKGEEIELYVSEKNNQTAFLVGEDLLVGRLIDAEYPDFGKIIPTDFSTTAEFDKQEMQNGLKTTAVFARDNANIVRFSVEKDRITISAKSPSLGENSVYVSANTKGEENEIAFNSRYVQELLQNTDAETMIFEMTGPLNPGVFKIKGQENFIHLIMPIRVREEEV